MQNEVKEREKFGSRLGFILVSAGCAVGLGNVWKFPYICGENGGAAFVLIYLVFLAAPLPLPRPIANSAHNIISGVSCNAGISNIVCRVCNRTRKW